MKRAAFLLSVIVGCSEEPQRVPDLGPAPVSKAVTVAAQEQINPRLLRRFQSMTAMIRQGAEVGEEAVQLGRMLYFDTRLSKNNDLSCHSCHRLNRYGVDNEITSIGAGGKRLRRNSPTVVNAAGHFAQFWDGRAVDVEEQAKGPILAAGEMGMTSGDEVVGVLKGVPGYVAAFARAFPGTADPMTYDNIGRAIGAFERRLFAPSRWDAFLDGDQTALTHAEIEGLKLFADVGCVQCHTGIYLGGSMFQGLGVVNPWPRQDDLGRFEITKNNADRMQFKVPGLRNIAMTGPYLHDGSVATLEETVQLMGWHQLGVKLEPAEIASIIVWLKSLTGELPKEYVDPPQLP